MVETNIPCEVGSKQIPVNVTLEVDLALNFRQHSLLQPGNPRTVPQLRCQSPSSGSYRGPTLPIRGREDVRTTTVIPAKAGIQRGRATGKRHRFAL